MIQGTKWYGYIANDPQSYFDKKCHSYQDISDLITNKGPAIIKDIAPCIESFMHQSEDIISDDLVDNLIISDTYNSICVANEAISYTIDNIAKLKPCAENSSWFIWSDIPHIERAYRMGKINESAVEILNTALESCAEKVVSNFTTFDTDKIKPAVEEFINNVTWDDMIHWKDRRETIMESSSISGYIGDLITEINPSNWRDLAIDGRTSNFDVCLEDVANNLRYRNPSVSGSLEGYSALAFDIYAEMLETNEDTFDTTAQNLYQSRQMTISVESFMDSIHRMINYGMLPALENLSYDKMTETADHLREKLNNQDTQTEIKDSPVTESALLFNTYITDTYGKIPFIDNIDAYFSRLTAAIESTDEQEERVSDKHKAARAIKDGARKGEIAVTRAYNKYKLHEEDADEKMSHVIKLCKDVVFGSHENARREIIEGKGTSVVAILKTVLGGVLIFNTSKVAFLLILITRWCNSGKIKRAERKKIIAELEGEIEILDEKINHARYHANDEQSRETLYALMRTRNDVKHAIQRIKLKDSAERTHAGVGLPKGILRR